MCISTQNWHYCTPSWHHYFHTVQRVSGNSFIMCTELPRSHKCTNLTGALIYTWELRLSDSLFQITTAQTASFEWQLCILDVQQSNLMQLVCLGLSFIEHTNTNLPFLYPKQDLVCIVLTESPRVSEPLNVPCFSHSLWVHSNLDVQ